MIHIRPNHTKPFFASVITSAICFVFLLPCCKSAKPIAADLRHIQTVNIDSGWAANSVNTTVFRKNSLVTYGDTQFVAYYNGRGYVVLGKRKLGQSSWILKETAFRGNVSDAHNVISIMADAKGYLHLAWDHHNTPLNYARSSFPGSLDMQRSKMTGIKENKLSYPEFYRLRNGNLLLFYRDGGSGNGSLVINYYDTESMRWTTKQQNLIDGGGRRNPYWQACVDDEGTIHISWVWRETPDVASNHDLCYARSKDNGETWERSTGEKYQLPITLATAEVAQAIPEKSELINQTSMTTLRGHPYIATYWREAGDSVPQYHIVFHSDGHWRKQDLGFRRTPFSLSGGGTKRIPISRPQIVVWAERSRPSAAVIFRDNERAGKVSAAICSNLARAVWKVTDLSEENTGSWEPTFDTELWRSKGLLHLFVQRTEQADAEGRSALPPQMVQVLEWQPAFTKR